MKFPILKSQQELKVWREKQNGEIHFVPTMGGLHPGHGELIKCARNNIKRKGQIVLVSVFVNPLQFEPDEDFQKYPRTLNADSKLAYENGADAMWTPSFTDIFPGGADTHFQIKVPNHLKKYLCGAKRKNHFDGVATVVIHLLKLVQPKALILGEKDWQQMVILRNLIDDLALPVSIKTVPTYRDIDGLAYSSRNNYLNKVERERALVLPKILKKASNDYKKGKSLDIEEIRYHLNQNNLEVEYIEQVDLKSLHPIKEKKKLCLLAAAVSCGKTRLIDHAFLMTRKPIVAIDGPAGAGKSTVTKIFAEKLGLIYLDTGAMYRAVTWFIKKEKIDYKDDKKMLPILNNIKIKLELDENKKQIVSINNTNITNEIRSPEINALVSNIAAQKSVRDCLTKQQKLLGIDGGLVAEGRDIGTTVFPDAELKIFLTASAKERAKRRRKDLKDRGYSIPSLIELEKEINARDKKDSNREIAPLIQAEDAYKVTTDNLSIEEVIEKLIYLFRLNIPEEVWRTPTN